MPSVVLIMEFRGKRLDCGVYSASSEEQLVRLGAPYEGDVAASVASVVEQVVGMKGTVVIDAAVSLPSERVSQRVLNLPFDDKRKLDEVAAFEAGESFLSEAHSIVLQATPLTDGKALVAAVDKEYLKSVLADIKGSGLDPTWVGLSLFSRHMLLPVGRNPDVTAAVVDEHSIAVVKGSMPRFFKELKDAGDVAMAMLAASAEGFVPEEVYAEKGAGAIAEKICPDVRYLDAIAEGCSGIEAMAIHYFRGIDGAINFRAGEFAHTAGAKRG
ncbi:MAG: hypothetical protein OEV28_13745, partial [Nitrospirota bacterium]|nr:hypothetical protein [Nitrospirota bacterium]